MGPPTPSTLRHPRPALFVALEGIEGSGKTRQTRLLAEWLASAGVPHISVREPGGTVAGEEIRRLLLESEQLSDRAELLLMLAARAVLVESVIRPALEAGKIVLTDRFELSTLAYQAYGRGLPLDEIRALNNFATRGLTPVLTIVLDVPQEIGEARRVRTGRHADRIEQAGRAFHGRVAEAYQLLASQEQNVERVDGDRPVEEVHADIVRRLRDRFPETFPEPKG